MYWLQWTDWLPAGKLADNKSWSRLDEHSDSFHDELASTDSKKTHYWSRYWWYVTIIIGVDLLRIDFELERLEEMKELRCFRWRQANYLRAFSANLEPIGYPHLPHSDSLALL